MDKEYQEENMQLSDERDFWFSHLDICVMQDKSLSFAAKGIYALLTTYMDVKSRSWSVKIKTLSETAGISERQVRYAVKELKEKGYIKVDTVFREGHQCASKYTLIGHRAAEQPAIYAPQDCTPCTPRGAHIAGQLLEPVLRESKDTPTEEAEASGCSPSLMEKVPSAMKSTAEYMLLKTGRKGLLPSEIGAIMALEKRHYPARVQQEISVALERFIHKGRLPEELTFEYIYESLRRQKSKKEKTQLPANDPPLPQKPVVTKEQEEAHERWIKQKYGGGAGHE